MSNLTTSQHERLRNLVRRSPAFIGMRVEVHDDRVEVGDPEDLVFGLGPVEEAVAGEPADRWPELVDGCLGRILSALTGDMPDLDGPTEQLLDRVYAKLRTKDTSPTEWWTYAPEVAPGLLVVIALDYPDRIAILNDEQVRRHGGFDRLLEAGVNNLYRQAPRDVATHEDVFIVAGAEYTASTALVLPWIVEVLTGAAEFPHGVLVAVPDDETLVFHVVRDGAGTRYAVSEIARVAASCYEESPRALSPTVYWWAEGSGYLEPVADLAGDRSGAIGQDVVTRYSAGFARVLADLDQVRS